MPELLNKSDVMRIINAENAVVLCCTRLRSTDEVLYSIASQINSLQTIQNTIEAEPLRHGRWIQSDALDYKDPIGVIHVHGMCSCCRMIYDFRDMTSRFKFCPNCGARMDATDTNVGGKGGADNG